MISQDQQNKSGTLCFQTTFLVFMFLFVDILNYRAQSVVGER